MQAQYQRSIQYSAPRRWCRQPQCRDGHVSPFPLRQGTTSPVHMYIITVHSTKRWWHSLATRTNASNPSIQASKAKFHPSNQETSCHDSTAAGATLCEGAVRNNPPAARDTKSHRRNTAAARPARAMELQGAAGANRSIQRTATCHSHDTAAKGAMDCQGVAATSHSARATKRCCHGMEYQVGSGNNHSIKSTQRQRRALERDFWQGDHKTEPVPPQETRNAQCGLRGVRVGEASNPGPLASFKLHQALKPSQQQCLSALLAVTRQSQGTVANLSAIDWDAVASHVLSCSQPGTNQIGDSVPGSPAWAEEQSRQLDDKDKPFFAEVGANLLSACFARLQQLQHAGNLVPGSLPQLTAAICSASQDHVTAGSYNMTEVATGWAVATNQWHHVRCTVSSYERQRQQADSTGSVSAAPPISRTDQRARQSVEDAQWQDMMRMHNTLPAKFQKLMREHLMKVLTLASEVGPELRERPRKPLSERCSDTSPAKSGRSITGGNSSSSECSQDDEESAATLSGSRSRLQGGGQSAMAAQPAAPPASSPAAAAAATVTVQPAAPPASPPAAAPVTVQEQPARPAAAPATVNHGQREAAAAGKPAPAAAAGSPPPGPAASAAAHHGTHSDSQGGGQSTMAAQPAAPPASSPAAAAAATVTVQPAAPPASPPAAAPVTVQEQHGQREAAAAGKPASAAAAGSPPPDHGACRSAPAASAAAHHGTRSDSQGGGQSAMAAQPAAPPASSPAAAAAATVTVQPAAPPASPPAAAPVTVQEQPGRPEAHHSGHSGRRGHMSTEHAGGSTQKPGRRRRDGQGPHRSGDSHRPPQDQQPHEEHLGSRRSGRGAHSHVPAGSASGHAAPARASAASRRRKPPAPVQAGLPRHRDHHDSRRADSNSPIRRRGSGSAMPAPAAASRVAPTVKGQHRPHEDSQGSRSHVPGRRGSAKDAPVEPRSGDRGRGSHVPQGSRAPRGSGGSMAAQKQTAAPDPVQERRRPDGEELQRHRNTSYAGSESTYSSYTEESGSCTSDSAEYESDCDKHAESPRPREHDRTSEDKNDFLKEDTDDGVSSDQNSNRENATDRRPKKRPRGAADQSGRRSKKQTTERTAEHPGKHASQSSAQYWPRREGTRTGAQLEPRSRVVDPQRPIGAPPGQPFAYSKPGPRQQHQQYQQPGRQQSRHDRRTWQDPSTRHDSRNWDNNQRRGGGWGETGEVAPPSPPRTGARRVRKKKKKKTRKKKKKKNYGLGNIKATSINLMVAIEGRELAKLKHQDRTPRTQTAHSLYVFARTGSRERAVHSLKPAPARACIPRSMTDGTSGFPTLACCGCATSAKTALAIM